MTKFSFDIVSDYDKAEMNNVFDQTKREITGRYDLKNTKASIEWLTSDKNGLKITGNSDFHIDAILDIYRKKLASRGLSQKVLDLSAEPITTNLVVSQQVLFKKGIGRDDAKKITSLIRSDFPKVATQIQGEEVRVTSAKKDELQEVMNLIKTADFNFPVIFTNFR